MISIIIPTLNEEKHLPKLLRSVKKQSFQEEIEIIVADAGSRDETRKIAKNFGCRIIEGGLAAKGRNQGAKIAKGDIFLFIDADVVLPKGFLKKALGEFLEKRLDGASFSLRPLNANAFERMLFNFFYNYPVRLMVRLFPFGAMIFLVKKEVHRKIGGFNQEVVFLEDTDYVRRLAKNGRYGFLSSVSVLVSDRRFQKDGWVKTYLKVILGNIYTILFGPIKRDIFKYRFNHYKDLSD